jgi:serine/threonine protein kinase
MEETTPSARFDRYEVLAPLGAGGMGEVVKARALGPHGFEKIVAIKRIKAEWADQEVMADRFVREARIAARLQHSNIVQVFDFGRHGDELFIVMEYVDGLSLDSILASLAQEGKRMTLAQALEVALDVSRALDTAHTLPGEDGEGMGVVHRDVSPANILVSRTGVVKLTDFGIAAVASQQGRTSLIAGKPLYMAPEQLRGDRLDGRADLFAVGIVTYEMLTGARPWKGTIDTARDATLEQVGYTPPSKLLTGVPKDLDVLLERLLTPDASARLSSARELTKEIIALSYRCQIVLDSSELTPLITQKGDEAHAPTLPQYMNKVRTLVATGVSPDGVTVLKTADDERAAPAVETSIKRRSGVPSWGWAMLAMFAIGAALIAVYAFGGEEPVSRTAVADREPEPPPEPAVQRPEPAPPPEPEVAPEPEPIVEEPAAVEPAVVEPAVEPAIEPSEAPERERRPRRPREEAAPQPSAGGTGTLAIFSRPWAHVWIDGVRQTRTAPMPPFELPAGRHRVRLENPELGLSTERTVDVPAGGSERLSVDLTQAN